jgi:hypothetical protein
MSVGADGYSFGVAGRVYGGVPFQAKVSSRGGNGGGLFGADWFISGGVTSRGLAEIEERGRATYVRNCRYLQDTSACRPTRKSDGLIGPHTRNTSQILHIATCTIDPKARIIHRKTM